MEVVGSLRKVVEFVAGTAFGILAIPVTVLGFLTAVGMFREGIALGMGFGAGTVTAVTLLLLGTSGLLTPGGARGRGWLYGMGGTLVTLCMCVSYLYYVWDSSLFV